MVQTHWTFYTEWLSHFPSHRLILEDAHTVSSYMGDLAPKLCHLLRNIPYANIQSVIINTQSVEKERHQAPNQRAQALFNGQSVVFWSRGGFITSDVYQMEGKWEPKRKTEPALHRRKTPNQHRAAVSWVFQPPLFQDHISVRLR